MLPPFVIEGKNNVIGDETEKGVLSGKLTREKLIGFLNESGWNKAEAARRLGLNRTVVWRHMKKWDIPLQKL